MVLKFIKDFEDLTAAERFLAYTIAAYWSPTKLPFPSIQTLCKDTGYSISYIGKLKASLNKKGVLKVENKAKPGSPLDWESSRFRFSKRAIHNHWCKHYLDRSKKPHEQSNAEYDFSEFYEFWHTYPKAAWRAEKQCKAEWLKINPNNGQFAEIMAGLKRYKQTENWKAGKYILAPLTFLKGERWKDEIEVTPTVFQGPKGQEFR